ncbi:lengsin-like [Amphiura filiformis]|uniref:lengsin-like n=1 Tax=Amphiura filiformis TaxID=82378 RepID=UPI003B217FE9
MDSNKDQLEQIMSKIHADDVKFIRFEQTDIYGVARSKTVPVKHFTKKAIYGINFALTTLGYDPQGQCTPGTGFLFESGSTDALMFPDLDTFITIPWCKNTGRILLEPTYKGKPVAAHPRTVARLQLDRLKDMGYSLLSAHEHEFYVADKNTLEPFILGQNIRSTIRNYKDPELVHQLLTDLPQADIDVETYESEHDPGQLEITYTPSFGVKSADTAHTFRTSVKEIASQHGYIASFMTKPWAHSTRSACHFNHSLWDINGENNLMMDNRNPDSLSDVARHWLAGILAHAPAVSLLMAPTINCLKAFEPSSTSINPVNATWGFDNRTTALRVKVGDTGAYIENRICSGGANPYLTLAATVAAGIDGIQNQMEPPPHVNGNAYDPDNIPTKTPILPSNMKTALENLSNDNIICEALGDEFVKCFVAHKLHELCMENEAKAKGDTDWERNLFFEYL